MIKVERQHNKHGESQLLESKIISLSANGTCKVKSFQEMMLITSLFDLRQIDSNKKQASEMKNKSAFCLFLLGVYSFTCFLSTDVQCTVRCCALSLPSMVTSCSRTMTTAPRKRNSQARRNGRKKSSEYSGNGNGGEERTPKRIRMKSWCETRNVPSARVRAVFNGLQDHTQMQNVMQWVNDNIPRTKGSKNPMALGEVVTDNQGNLVWTYVTGERRAEEIRRVLHESIYITDENEPIDVTSYVEST